MTATLTSAVVAGTYTKWNTTSALHDVKLTLLLMIKNGHPQVKTPFGADLVFTDYASRTK
jgi:hypothetical protein